MEIELRFKIESSISQIKRSLEEKGYKYLKSEYQLDEYYKIKGNEKEADITGSQIFRTRKTNESYLFTNKKTVEPGVWDEFETEEQQISKTVKGLLNNYFSKILTLEKNRDMYLKKNFAINVDIVEGLGNYVEVEVISDENPTKVKEMITLEVKNLFTCDVELIEKGYVTLMKEKLI